MKFLTIIMLALFSISGFTMDDGHNIITKKDCKELEKALGNSLKAQGYDKKEIKEGKRIIKLTCKIAVEEKMTQDEYVRKLVSALNGADY